MEHTASRWYSIIHIKEYFISNCIFINFFNKPQRTSDCYLKISRRANEFAMHYSQTGDRWKLARYFCFESCTEEVCIFALISHAPQKQMRTHAHAHTSVHILSWWKLRYFCFENAAEDVRFYLHSKQNSIFMHVHTFTNIRCLEIIQSIKQLIFHFLLQILVGACAQAPQGAGCTVEYAYLNIAKEAPRGFPAAT